MVVGALVGLAWRRLWHDPLGLVFTFLAPIAVASVMVGIYTAVDPTDGTPVGVYSEEASGPVTRDLEGRLGATEVLEIRRFADRAALERAILRREVAAGVVVPAAVERSTDRPATVELLGPPEVALPGGVRAAVEAATVRTAAVVQLGRTLVPEGDPATALAAGRAAMTTTAGNAGASSTSTEQSWGFAETAVLGTLVLFVGMNTMAAGSIVADLRRLRVLARARTTRATPWSLALGIGLALTTYALVEAGLMLATGRLAFGVTFAAWPSFLVVAAALGLAGGALGLLTGTLLPSVESGTTVAGPAGFVLAMLGGCLWPLDIVGPTLRRIGHLTPHAWAVDALRATGVEGAGVADVAPELGVLLAMTAAFLLVGGRRLIRIAARA